MKERPITTSEAAARLGIERSTVSRYIKRGLIKAEKWGRDWLILPSELERFESARRKAGRPPKEKD